MPQSIVQPLLWAVVLALALKAIGSFRHRPAATVDGWKYATFHGVAGVLWCGLAALGLLLAHLTYRASTGSLKGAENLPGVAMVIGGIGTAGALLASALQRSWIRWNGDRIEYQPVFGKARAIEFQAVTEVMVSKRDSLRIYAGTGSRIDVSHFANGYGDLLKELRARRVPIAPAPLGWMARLESDNDLFVRKRIFSPRSAASRVGDWKYLSFWNMAIRFFIVQLFIFGLIALGGYVGDPVMFANRFASGLWQTVVVILAALGLASIGAAFLLRFRLRWSHEVIELQVPWRPKVIMKFDQIVRVERRPRGAYVLVDTSGNAIPVVTTADGIAEFLSDLRAKGVSLPEPLTALLKSYGM